ncbi:MAG: hypothetical protein H6707_20095 [Deltaproteobacteria bacterium]|nr:hypothetical protein [Deltaproteobacteria bacterium]
MSQIGNSGQIAFRQLCSAARAAGIALLLWTACGPLPQLPFAWDNGGGKAERLSATQPLSSAELRELPRPAGATIERAYRVSANRVVIVGRRQPDGGRDAYLLEGQHWTPTVVTPFVIEDQIIAAGDLIVTSRCIDDPRSISGHKQIILIYTIGQGTPQPYRSSEDVLGSPSPQAETWRDAHWSYVTPQSVVIEGHTASTIDIVANTKTAGLDLLIVEQGASPLALPLTPDSRFDRLAGISEEQLAPGIRLTNPMQIDVPFERRAGDWVRRNLGSGAYRLGQRLYDRFYDDRVDPSAVALVPNTTLPQVPIEPARSSETYFGTVEKLGVWYKLDTTGLNLMRLPSPAAPRDTSEFATAYSWEPRTWRLGLAMGVGRPEPFGDEDDLFGSGIPPHERLADGRVVAIFNAGWHSDWSAFYADAGHAPHRSFAQADRATLLVSKAGTVVLGDQQLAGWRWSSSTSSVAPDLQRLAMLWQNMPLLVAAGRLHRSALLSSPFTQGAPWQSALGITTSGRMIYAMARASVEQMAELMIRLGCVFATPLDVHGGNNFFYLLGPPKDSRLPEQFSVAKPAGPLRPRLRPHFYLWRER